MKKRVERMLALEPQETAKRWKAVCVRSIRNAAIITSITAEMSGKPKKLSLKFEQRKTWDRKVC